MRWIGLNDGYVSGDGSFLVAQVTVPGRRGPARKWALYGLERVQSDDPERCTWQWSARPIHGPLDTKGACQEWALQSGYEPPVVSAASAPAPRVGMDKPMGYEICQECGVHYHRKPRHPFADYCGDNCFDIVVERIDEIRQNLGRRRVAS